MADHFILCKSFGVWRWVGLMGWCAVVLRVWGDHEKPFFRVVSPGSVVSCLPGGVVSVSRGMGSFSRASPRASPGASRGGRRGGSPERESRGGGLLGPKGPKGGPTNFLGVFSWNFTGKPKNSKRAFKHHHQHFTRRPPREGRKDGGSTFHLLEKERRDEARHDFSHLFPLLESCEDSELFVQCSLAVGNALEEIVEAIRLLRLRVRQNPFSSKTNH